MENSNTKRRKRQAKPIKSGKITAIQVLTILGIVLFGIYFIVVCALGTAIGVFLYLLLMGFPCCCAFIPLSKLGKVKNTSQLMAWSILNLIFFNIITGILYLCLNDKEIKNYQEYQRQQMIETEQDIKNYYNDYYDDN